MLPQTIFPGKQRKKAQNKYSIQFTLSYRCIHKIYNSKYSSVNCEKIWHDETHQLNIINNEKIIILGENFHIIQLLSENALI